LAAPGGIADFQPSQLPGWTKSGNITAKMKKPRPAFGFSFFPTDKL
jgi:hypothetical protein